MYTTEDVYVSKLKVWFNILQNAPNPEQYVVLWTKHNMSKRQTENGQPKQTADK